MRSLPGIGKDDERLLRALMDMGGLSGRICMHLTHV